MSLEIRQVDANDKKQLRQFILFPEKLYKHNPYYVPNLVFDEMDTLNPSKNPASDFCDQVLYMAYKDGKPVGRIAGIINRWANERWKHDEVRFGWFDTIDDIEVYMVFCQVSLYLTRKLFLQFFVCPLAVQKEGTIVLDILNHVVFSHICWTG